MLMEGCTNCDTDPLADAAAGSSPLAGKPETVQDEKKGVHRVLSLIVVGASGDLAWKKTFPAIFSLWWQGLVPRDIIIVGYARSHLDLAKFRAKISQKVRTHHHSVSTPIVSR